MNEHEYPESQKALQVRDESQSIGQFIDWLREEKHLYLCQVVHGLESNELAPTDANINSLLAQYFEINEAKLEAEKQHILANLRKTHELEKQNAETKKCPQCGCMTVSRIEYPTKGRICANYGKGCSYYVKLGQQEKMPAPSQDQIKGGR